jgi:quercetin dioxygenase-like cupin family protein
MTTSARYLVSLRVSAFILTLALGWCPQVANSQQVAPDSNQGFNATPKQVVDLGPEIDGMEGRQLRMRLITIAPGGHNTIHSHADRPVVVYFLQGTDTVTFGDGTVNIFRPGDTSFANKDTTHWHRNDGEEPVVFIAVDVFHNAQ